MSPVSAGMVGASSRRKLWTPAQLGSTALKMWLDASDAATLTLSGSNVTTWGDKSGNSRNMTQATGTAQPTRQTNVQNGMAVVRFDGTSDYMATASSGVSAQPYSWVGLFKPNAVNVYKRILQGLTPDAGNIEHTAGAQWVLYAGSAASNVGTSYAAWTIAIPTYNGSSSTLWVNGSQQGTTYGLGTLTPSVLRLSSTGDFFSGDMGEVLFIGGTLASGDRQKIEGYLAHRWGLTSLLPAGHPYKTVAP